MSLLESIRKQVLESENRLSTCKGCEFYSEGKCSKCGCYMVAKTKLPFATCPENKWVVKG